MAQNRRKISLPRRRGGQWRNRGRRLDQNEIFREIGLSTRSGGILPPFLFAAGGLFYFYQQVE